MHVYIYVYIYIARERERERERERGMCVCVNYKRTVSSRVQFVQNEYLYVMLKGKEENIISEWVGGAGGDSMTNRKPVSQVYA